MAEQSRREIRTVYNPWPPETKGHMADRLIEKLTEYAALERQKKDMAQHYKELMDQLVAEIKELRVEIRKGEPTEMAVDVIEDHKKGVYKIVDIDTGDVLESGEMPGWSPQDAIPTDDLPEAPQSPQGAGEPVDGQPAG